MPSGASSGSGRMDGLPAAGPWPPPRPPGQRDSRVRRCWRAPCSSHGPPRSQRAGSESIASRFPDRGPRDRGPVTRRRTGTLRRSGILSRGAGLILLLGPAFQVQFLQAQPTDTATVITRDELRATGRTTLAEALQVLVPSFNSPRPSGGGGDGGDPVRPASLRGMGADQLVVLVNGKRRQGSALVNLHAKIGRGEAATDLDAIPLAAIEQVEIIRAPSVRYGSSAVAGVINIVTGSRLPGELIANLGVTSEGDGGTAQVGAT